MAFLFAAVLVLHGFAHLVGFLGAWRLAEGIPYHTTLLDGAVDVGDAGIRVAGILWLVTGLAFVAAAVAVLVRASWWPAFTVLVAIFSTLLCLLACPEARAGAVLDVVLVGGVFLGMRLGWFDVLATR